MSAPIISTKQPMHPEYTLDVPADSYLRCVAVGGQTMFLLATHTPESGLCCRLTAFDLAHGRVRATLDLPYIKLDNGGGTLSCTATGDRVAVGSESWITIYDVCGERFVLRESLSTEQETCAAKFIEFDRTIHWSATTFALTRLRSGKSHEGQDLEAEFGSLADFAIEPDGQHLLAVGASTSRGPEQLTVLHRIRVRDFKIVRSYQVPGYVIPDPVIDTNNRAYLLNMSDLLELDLRTGAHRVVVQGPLGPAALAGFSSCAKLWHGSSLHVVTSDELLTVDIESGRYSAQAFPRAVQGAGFDAQGWLWTFDAASKVCGWDMLLAGDLGR